VFENESGVSLLPSVRATWAPRQVQSLWGAKSIFITENGCLGRDRQ